MNALPYYPRYPRDFFEGTAGMTLEEKGAYGLVLDLIYMMGSRGLPDDPQYIAGQLGTSVRKWNALKKSLIERGKLTAENGIISNKRADKVKKKQRLYQDNQAENARGARENNDLGKPSQAYREEPKPDTDIGGGSSACADLTFREQVILAMGHNPSGVTANGKIIGNQADFAGFEKARLDLNLSEQEAIQAVTEATAGKLDGPATSMKYFIPPMQRLAGAKSAEKVVPIEGRPISQVHEKLDLRAIINE